MFRNEPRLPDGRRSTHGYERACPDLTHGAQNPEGCFSMSGGTIDPRQADRCLVERLLYTRANGSASRFVIDEYQRPSEGPHLLGKSILDRSFSEMSAREIVDESHRRRPRRFRRMESAIAEFPKEAVAG
jgi:hypothetical protein